MRGLVGVFGQGFGFYALTQLPLAEVTAIQYTLPLLTVAAGACSSTKTSAPIAGAR